jgi:hypothetical protein
MLGLYNDSLYIVVRSPRLALGERAADLSFLSASRPRCSRSEWCMETLSTSSSCNPPCSLRGHVKPLLLVMVWVMSDHPELEVKKPAPAGPHFKTRPAPHHFYRYFRFLYWLFLPARSFKIRGAGRGGGNFFGKVPTLWPPDILSHPSLRDKFQY